MAYFTNPYNFVPLEGKCVRSKLTLGDEEHLTGFFECELELLTPLFIPNTSCKRALCSEGERQEKYVGYEFCSYEDLSGNVFRGKNGYVRPPREPVIPGSEIRGAVRSVYEAAFGGCMSTMHTDAVVKRRNPRPKRPGILERNTQGAWDLIPCERAQHLILYRF